MEQLILVNRQDEPLGFQEKLKAHLIPQRHRAFSVFIFNERGETLIQRRSPGKYHSPGLWANTCCGHPRFLEEGTFEDTLKAAQRRLQEEMGFQVPLNLVTHVCYTLHLEKGLWELEYTHVFHGFYGGPMTPDPAEVSEWAWMAPEAIREDVKRHPENYARWFRLYVLKHFEGVFGSRSAIRARA